MIPNNRRTHSTGLASARNASAFFFGTPAPRAIGVSAVMGSGAVVARKAHNLEVAGSIPASPTPRSLRMVAAPRGEPLGRTPRLARWPAARISFQARVGASLDDSVAKMVDAYGSRSADVVGNTTLPSPVITSGTQCHARRIFLATAYNKPARVAPKWETTGCGFESRRSHRVLFWPCRSILLPG